MLIKHKKPNIMRHFLIAFMVLLSVVSCEDDRKKNYLPNSVGAINTLSVVIDNEMWKGAVGDTIRKYYAAEVIGLPWVEPMFSIHQMPPEVFTGNTRSSRNILVVQKDTAVVAGIKTDLYAEPQKVALIKGPSDQVIMEKIASTAEKAIATFKMNDIKESQKRFTRSLNRETDLQEELGISLTMPSVYKIAKQENNFFWIERQIPKGTMNIL